MSVIEVDISVITKKLQELRVQAAKGLLRSFVVISVVVPEEDKSKAQDINCEYMSWVEEEDEDTILATLVRLEHEVVDQSEY